MPTARNRDYSSPPDTFHSMSANYAWNPYAVVTGANGITTGAWSSTELSQDGSLRVSLTSGINIDSLNISGLVVNTDQLETINTSGTQYLAAISGNTNRSTDNASGYAAETFLKVGGRAVEVASGFAPNYSSGASAELNISRENGSLLVQPTDLNYQYDSVVAYSPQSTTVSNSSISGSFGATALQTGIALYANTGRKNFFIQNTSSVANLFVKLGSPPVSSGSFSLILNKSSEAGAGGGSFSNENYLGDVSVSGQSFIAWELS